PAIADSFNNVGVIEAQNQKYAAAAGYFRQAARWNPQMGGLDYNWGRAAFGAKDYRQAVICLSRYMQLHPGDNRSRVPLGMSQFMLADYKSAIDTLAPLGPEIDTIPLLSYAYAESLVKAGNPDEGIDRLQRLEAAHPDFEMAPAALGEAFLDRKQYQKAESQLREVLRIHPANRNARFDLALTLLALDRRDEAQKLLMQLAQSGEKSPDVYYQLGRIQMDRGDIDDAIVNFAAAANLAPKDESVRVALASACRRNNNPRRPECKISQNAGYASPSRHDGLH
ncbi:MAG: tetratricopeptide repeat protein, partial [Acidobacteriaceae bacterium]